jgi:hypothetical protein
MGRSEFGSSVLLFASFLLLLSSVIFWVVFEVCDTSGKYVIPLTFRKSLETSRQGTDFVMTQVDIPHRPSIATRLHSR